MASNPEESIQTIEDFLSSLGLQEYASILEKEGVDLDSLTELSEEDLKDIGITKIGHRKKILKNIKRIPGTEGNVNVIENIQSKSEERTPMSSVKASKGNEPVAYGRDEEIRIAIVGKTGGGKSATANSILGEKMFDSEPLLRAVTSNCGQASRARFHKKIVIVDTPGVCDPHREDADMQNEIKQCITITAPGPHAFILVLGLGRYTEEEHKAVQHFIKHFGDSIYEYFIVLFTRKDDLDRAGRSLQEVIENAPENLKEFIKRCQNRVLAFDNTLEGAAQEIQVKELLKIIDENIARNGGNFYTNKMYKEAEKLMEKRQKEIQEQENEQWEVEKRKIKEDVAEQFQAELKSKEKEMEDIQSKIKDLEDLRVKNDQEAEDKENKLKALINTLTEKIEEQKIINEKMDEELEKKSRDLDKVIDDHTREKSRREAAENQGAMILAANALKWVYDYTASYFSS